MHKETVSVIYQVSVHAKMAICFHVVEMRKALWSDLSFYRYCCELGIDIFA